MSPIYYQTRTVDLLVQVSQDHIDAGAPGSLHCPVALAINDALAAAGFPHVWVIVGTSHLNVADRRLSPPAAVTQSISVAAFVGAALFDYGRAMVPFGFPLHLRIPVLG